MAKRFKIKPIETRYDGYKFRSRIEARWALFFKTLGAPYEYEKEGYQLPDGTWYLCDFWLPKDFAWIVIKGEKPSQLEILKLTQLAQGTQCRAAYIFWGPIPHPTTWKKTWKVISVLNTAQSILANYSDARISYALNAARSARF